MRISGILSFVFVSGLLLGGCGYTLSPSPYGLVENLSLSVPVAENKSRYGELGPMLTGDVIARLDASSSIRVSEGAPAKLRLHIVNVTVTGGAWEVEDNNDIPKNSASRVVHITVEAVLERPGPASGAPPQTRRQTFSGQRTFLVSDSQPQVEMRQAEAFRWLVNDLSQKISQNMFSEF